MTLRLRLMAAAAVAVAIAVMAVAGVSYFVVAQRVNDQVDQELMDQSSPLLRGPALERAAQGPRDDGIRRDPTLYQIITDTGVGLVPGSQAGAIEITRQDLDVARGRAEAYYHDITVKGVEYRVVTRPAGPGVAVEYGKPLTEVNATLADLRLVLGLVALCGVVLAAALGLLVARMALKPVRKLTKAAEHVAATRDLAATIEVSGNDEIARLAGSINDMLAALNQSLLQQRQLVADASHELRTPLTSLRTNVEVLAAVDNIEPAEKAELLGDIVEQLDELTVLIGDLAELAREDTSSAVLDVTELRLDEIVEREVERARLHTPGVSIKVTNLEATVLDGQLGMVARAISNVLDNACKWSPANGTVDVELVGGRLHVSDRGPGISDDDIDHIFDRFYRAAAARAKPGSGLGLAIVRHAVDSHGGTAEAAGRDGGGTMMTLWFGPTTHVMVAS